MDNPTDEMFCRIGKRSIVRKENCRFHKRKRQFFLMIMFHCFYHKNKWITPQMKCFVELVKEVL